MQRLIAALFSALIITLVLSQQSLAQEWRPFKTLPEEEQNALIRAARRLSPPDEKPPRITHFSYFRQNAIVALLEDGTILLHEDGYSSPVPSSHATDPETISISKEDNPHYADTGSYHTLTLLTEAVNVNSGAINIETMERFLTTVAADPSKIVPATAYIFGKFASTYRKTFEDNILPLIFDQLVVLDYYDGSLQSGELREEKELTVAGKLAQIVAFDRAAWKRVTEASQRRLIILLPETFGQLEKR